VREEESDVLAFLIWTGLGLSAWGVMTWRFGIGDTDNEVCMSILAGLLSLAIGPLAWLPVLMLTASL
jgi:hypothetical protein